MAPFQAINLKIFESYYNHNNTTPCVRRLCKKGTDVGISIDKYKNSLLLNVGDYFIDMDDRIIL